MEPSPFTFFLAGHREPDGRFTPYSQELYRRSGTDVWEHLHVRGWVGCDEPVDVDPLTHEEAARWRESLIGARTVAPFVETTIDHPHDLPDAEPDPEVALSRYDRAGGPSLRLRAAAVLAVVVVVVLLVMTGVLG